VQNASHVLFGAAGFVLMGSASLQAEENSKKSAKGVSQLWTSKSQKSDKNVHSTSIYRYCVLRCGSRLAVPSIS
jgi:hypothetical protein